MARLPAFASPTARRPWRISAPHHERLSTSPDSGFVQTLLVQHPYPDRIVTLRARTWFVDGPGLRERRVLADPASSRRCCKTSSGSISARSVATGWTGSGEGGRPARGPSGGRGSGPVGRLSARNTLTVAFAPSARHLTRAKDLADARYSEPLTVDDMAAAAGLTRAHFSREFRRAFGEPPHTYLLTRRLERAAALLRNTDSSVTEICYSVGLRSLGSFTTSFTRTFGVSPTAYRAAHPPAAERALVPACFVRAYSRPLHRVARLRHAGPALAKTARFEKSGPAPGASFARRQFPLDSRRHRMMKIANAQLWVHDQDEALAFWRDKVGMEVRADVTLPELGDFRWLAVGPPGQEDVSIVLMAIPGAPVMDEDTRSQVAALMAKGFAGTVFLTTDDVKSAYEELKGRGVEFTDPLEERPYGIDSGFRDPSGNSVRIAQLNEDFAG